MLLSRWISLGIFIILLIFITRENGKLKNKLTKYGIIFLEGMVGGLIIDSIGINAGYYYFPAHPIYSLSYWTIVLPCWGVFGMATNYLWDKLGKNKFMLGLTLTTPLLFTFYEGTNLLTSSWTYTVPIWTVMLGWTPLVLVFTGCHRRRDIKRRIEEKIEIAKQSQQFAIEKVWFITRLLVIIVMFPLLLVSLFRIFTELKNGESKLKYAKVLLMVE